jgi:small nuclear ribonucleoprotein F
MSQKIVPVNPKPFLEKLVGQSVVVKLKWGLEYRGYLDSKDDYMNFKMSETEEWGYEEETSGKRELKLKGKIGEVLIRCNNVLYIRQADNMGQAPNEEGEMAE